MQNSDSDPERAKEESDLPALYSKELQCMQRYNKPLFEDERYSSWKARNEINPHNNGLVSSLGQALQRNGMSPVIEDVLSREKGGDQDSFVPSQRQHIQQYLHNNSHIDRRVDQNFSKRYLLENNNVGNNDNQVFLNPHSFDKIPSNAETCNHDLYNQQQFRRFQPPLHSLCDDFPRQSFKTSNGCNKFCCTPQSAPCPRQVKTYNQSPYDTPVHHHSEPDRKKHLRKSKTELSIKNLYRILWLQNEQLGLLEKQVSKLIELNYLKEHSSCNEEVHNELPVKDNNGIEKVDISVQCSNREVEHQDIGVMTSFEYNCPKCNKTNSDSLTSDSESEDIPVDMPVDESLAFHGLKVPISEEPSPPASLHIEMQDYQRSSSDSEESGSSDEEEPVGWTFYDNVVGQVNNILHTSGRKKKSKRGFDVKQATMEQLKNLGLTSCEPSQSHLPKRVTFEQGWLNQQKSLKAESDTSMRINALASKYLNSAGAVGSKVQDISMCNIISGNTNMSLATMRYLERYQLVNCPENTRQRVEKRHKPKNKNKIPSKILDITAIKQQPKLLPKQN